MNCHSVESLLDLYCEDLCAAKAALSIAEHLAGCPSCAAKARQWRPQPSKARAPKRLKDLLLEAAAQDRRALPGLEEQPRAPRLAGLALVIFAAALWVLHAATPPIISQRIVGLETSPWRLP